jgi:hypothetical protein
VANMPDVEKIIGFFRLYLEDLPRDTPDDALRACADDVRRRVVQCDSPISVEQCIAQFMANRLQMPPDFDAGRSIVSATRRLITGAE